MAKPTAIVYIDGLNLQRRLIDQLGITTWVDYWHLVQLVLPNFDITRVRVFTAPVPSPEWTVAESLWRKQVHVNEKISIHLGRIKKTTRIYPLTSTNGISTQSGTVKVLKYEEKGSDVALAAHMVLDAINESASIYYIMTSDTDFEPVMNLLKNRLKVRLGVLSTTKNLPKLFSQLNPEVIRHVKLSQVKKALLKESRPLLN